MIDLFSTVFSSVCAGGVGLFTWVHRNLNQKLEETRNELVKHKISLEKKTDKSEVKEIISDKLEPIHVMLETIQEDVKEIKDNIKRK